MANIVINIIVVLALMSIQSLAIAQNELPPLPPPDNAENVKPLSAEEVQQFQDWLKSNGQHATASNIPLPPSAHKKPEHSSKSLVVVNDSPYDVDEPEVISPPMSYNKSQQVMLKAAPKSPPPSQDSIDAFNQMTQQNMPMTPQQMVKLRQLIDASQRAASIPATVPPKPVSSTIMMNLAPGATPPAVRLAQGYVTSLVFVDSSGAPWPIASYDIGDPKTTALHWDGKSNVILIQALTPYGDSDMVIRLVGLPTPLTVALVSGQRVVDYRIDIHVPGIGPNTKELPTGTPLPNTANQLLLSVLDGIAPPGSKTLKVIGGDCQAWLLGDTMFVRSRLTVLSPGWIGRMVSPDGMYAYEMQKTSSILVSQYGQPIELKVEGF